MRFLFSLSVVLLVAGAHEASATCANVTQRLFVAQPDDIFFTVGVPETRFIRHVFAFWNGPTASPMTNTDCGAVATSHVTGVLVEQTYGCPGTGCAISTTVDVDIASGVGSPNAFRFPYSGDAVLTGAIPVHYDGSSPAGTNGLITFHQRTGDNSTSQFAMGSVNVYVVAAGTPPQTWFQVTSSASNISGTRLRLDHPLLNGKSGAKVFVQHSQQGTLWNHPVAAFYDNGFPSARWHINNEDGTAMPVGLTFNVRIDPSAIKLRTQYPTEGPTTPFLIINHPVANLNPFANVVVTPVSAGTARMNHPYSVVYVSPHWQVRFADGANLPPSQSANGYPYVPSEPGFFVKIMGTGQFVDDNLASDPSGFFDTGLSNGSGVDIKSVGRTSGNAKILSRFCWSQSTANPIIATNNWSALPPPAPRNYGFTEAKYYGLGSIGGTLTVFHEDGTTMAPAAAFNVWAPNRDDCPPLPPLRSQPPF